MQKGEDTSERKNTQDSSGEAGTMENPILDLLPVIPRKTRSQVKPPTEFLKQPLTKRTPMQQPEIIDVDASPNINSSNPIMQTAVKMKKFFPEIKATTSLMDYFFLSSNILLF